jgi:hypothetical protein
MTASKLGLRFVLLLSSLFFLTFTANAQYRASLRGTVTDPQGNAVVGAKVTLTNADTSSTVVSTSDQNGIYQFNALPQAPYRLTVEQTGFKKKVLEHVQIIPEQPNSLDLPLEVGELAQTVTVSDVTQALDTETANLSGTINSNQIQHMPSFGRDVFQLIQLAPGVFGNGAQGGGGTGVNIPGTQGPGATGGNQAIFQTENGPQALAAGQQYENNGIQIDGISTSSAVWGGTTIITPSEESVESVKVLSNGYDAEVGRFSGAQISVTTKSGTNDIHGSLFLTTHQPNLNAFQRFNGQGIKVTRDENKFEQFGGSVGGPVWKNKIFVFFGYETIREPFSNVQANGWYDTPAFDALAPAGSIAAKYLSFPGNGVVGTLNTAATCTTAGLQEGVNCRTIPGQGINIGSPLTTPLGTHDMTWQNNGNPGVGSGLANVADIANYTTINPTKFSAAQYNGRVDANVTSKDRLAFTIYWVPLSKDNFNGNRGYDIFHHQQTNNALSAIWNRTISSTFLNEFRVNAAGWRWNEVSSNSQSPVGLPTDTFQSTGGITLNSFGPNVGSILNQWTYTAKDVATKIYGRHTLKFGGEATRLYYLQECPGCAVPHYQFFNIWDFLNDAPQEENAGFNPNTGFPTTIRQDQRESIWGLFVQDDFKLRRNLTINVGLRYSFFGPLSSKESNMLVATPGAGTNFLTGLTVHPGHSWNAQKNNFGPQIGLAWSPGRFNDKLVVRGGYGLNYNQEELAISANISNNPGLVVFPTFSQNTPSPSSCAQPLPNCGIVYAVSSGVNNLDGYPTNPNSIAPFGANGLPVTGSVGVQIFPNTLPTMRTHHYSADVQYDLGHNLVASLGYQGSLSRNIFFHENPLVVAAQGAALNPQIGGGDFWNVNGYANYNAMLAELKHQFSRQFSADAQFTWSKCMDTSSGPYFEQPYPFNLNLDYGRCDYNVGKAFKLFGVWQPVFFHGSNGWLEKIAGGWSLSGIFNLHSGFPWTPIINTVGGNLYCGPCGYNTLFPVNNLGGEGHSTSNSAFETVANSNFPNGGNAYFSAPPSSYTAFSGNNSGTALPAAPAVHRNSLNLPGYKALDLTLAKGFGLPKARVLGENARIELRVDAYNLFNNLNLNPNQISNNVNAGNFGTISGALAGRVIALGARFSF